MRGKGECGGSGGELIRDFKYSHARSETIKNELADRFTRNVYHRISGRNRVKWCRDKVLSVWSTRVSSHTLVSFGKFSQDQKKSEPPYVDDLLLVFRQNAVIASPFATRMVSICPSIAPCVIDCVKTVQKGSWCAQKSRSRFWLAPFSSPYAHPNPKKRSWTGGHNLTLNLRPNGGRQSKTLRWHYWEVIGRSAFDFQRH